MAFMKFKPLTPKFNFNKQISTDELPKYVNDYINDEEVLFAYRTRKDVALFTDKQIVLFNKRGIGKHVKEISAIPYHSIVTSAVFFGQFTSQIKITLYNTYPLTLSFLSAIDKVAIKKTYMLIENKVKNKF
ncbi:MAG TPA: PH domain-containing protein [Mollicutes bacterium]|nr:PH domain-containing protein [Mollicutes bacterium]